MEALVDIASLSALVSVLRGRGYRTLGPVVRDGAVVLGDIESLGDLPRGWHDVQGPGSYRLVHDEGDELFGWAVGPQSMKAELFPPSATEWRARRSPTGSQGDVGLSIVEETDDRQPVALFGARPCEVAAVRVLDGVLGSGPFPDPRFRRRRDASVVIAVECGAPGGSCFCSSMGTGPGLPDVPADVDLALTELLPDADASDGRGHRFLARSGSDLGAELLGQVPHGPADDVDRAGRVAVLEWAAAHMGRSLDTSGLPALLSRNIDHPRWGDVAERCLACGNCTLVCPTCFCSTVEDVSQLDGSVERRRSWASCFDLAHSFVHGGAVRRSTEARYRQWCTHKLSTWWDQFGMSGCVGCGRCITWCPVGIDITEEAAAIRRTDGARVAKGA